ncbi:hypothetical protein COW46_03830 [Candidatus Gracilibacteria bacterium CG17_big_fil_post_rev_8_21_14_2_50_48_13]|nr:MAG: hypothetical protein COW46_03830 [Candidatus Gracilibacteria bacterium CG17_big_fil_post_rev_8_21_14_2_50_48_13]
MQEQNTAELTSLEVMESVLTDMLHKSKQGSSENMIHSLVEWYKHTHHADLVPLSDTENAEYQLLDILQKLQSKIQIEMREVLKSGNPQHKMRHEDLITLIHTLADQILSVRPTVVAV